MLDRYFRRVSVLERLRAGNLGCVIDDLTTYLAQRGKTEEVIQQYARAVGHYDHWIGKKDLLPSPDVVHAFLEEHRNGCFCEVPRGSYLQLRAALNHVARMAMPSPPGPTDQDDRLGEYPTYLKNTCGLAPGTCEEYVQKVRVFLKSCATALDQLKPADVIKHITDRAQVVKLVTLKQDALVLRNFLRFLRIEGTGTAGLENVVPTVPTRRLANIPKVLTDDQVQRLLESFDRSKATGLRGYAIALCLVRLGLRAGEVAGLTLADIDWRRGTIRIGAGKRRRTHILPLPVDTGRAIVAYLRQVRPRTDCRHVFVRHRSSVGSPMSSNAVGGVIRGAHDRAKVGASSKGTHALRHTAASRLLRAGVTLKGIADILGHRRLDTTTIYAKVDLRALREVALPWPEVRP